MGEGERKTYEANSLTQVCEKGRLNFSRFQQKMLDVHPETEHFGIKLAFLQLCQKKGFNFKSKAVK